MFLNPALPRRQRNARWTEREPLPLIVFNPWAVV
jgi:hypothetical protein